MNTIIVLFNLKSDADVAAYEKWASEVDIVNVRRLPSCDAFDVYRCVGVLGSEDKPPYAYAEVLEVNDMTQFGTDVGTATMQQVAGQFREFADSPIFMLTERLPS